MKITTANFYIQSTNRYRMEEIMKEWCMEHTVPDGTTERNGRAIVSPIHNGWTVIYDEAVENNPPLLDPLGIRLSNDLASYVIAAVVYDQEVFTYTVYDDTGRVVDEYLSDPNYRTLLRSDAEWDEGESADRYDDELDNGRNDDDWGGETTAAYWKRPDVQLLEELSAHDMADADMFAELLGDLENGLSLADELLEEFALLLGMDEQYIGLSYRDWIEFAADASNDESTHIHVSKG
jgi:hypothetical protein